MTRKAPERKGTKSYMIRELAERGSTKRETFAELRPLVEAQIRPMVFSANVGGSRVPKSMAEQLVELKNEIGRVYAILGRSTSSDFDSEEIEIEESGLDSDTDISEDSAEEEEETETVKPRAKGKTRIEDSLRAFLIEVRRIRKFCIDRAEHSDKIDSISMRPAQAAAKLIPAGIPVKALIDVMTMHWPRDVRQDAGISDFDFFGFSKQVMKDRGITGNYHELFGYALILAECRQPIQLIGPFGTGKSFLAEQLSEYLEMKYAETPMTPGATRGDLLGRHTIGGIDRAVALAALGRKDELEPIANGDSSGSFITSQFCEIYGGGGVFNFEEIDASDPGMLLVLNNALAGKKLYNSASGEMIERHPDFIAISTANTFGLGANAEFTGRERLDSATIDRWRMGRIFVPLDESVEEDILFGRV